MTIKREDSKGHAAIATILLFGGLWGLTEATLGFGLHLLPRIGAMPPLAGVSNGRTPPKHMWRSARRMLNGWESPTVHWWKYHRDGVGVR